MEWRSPFNPPVGSHDFATRSCGSLRLPPIWVAKVRPRKRAHGRRYKLVVRRQGTSDALYEEAVFYGSEASEMATQFADQIDKNGLDDFLFKKSHNWRID
jgi:hypothetical protein